MASSKSSRRDEDFIRHVPDIVTDKILELLPIRMAAMTSVLSQQWRRSWLSLKLLVFDWKKCNRIISNILLHHSGPVHDFSLYIPEYADFPCNHQKPIVHSKWLYFLSVNKVRRIELNNLCEHKWLSTYIYWCCGLVHLVLSYYRLNSPPAGFSGFPKLQHLVLRYINFVEEDLFCSLMAKCRMLSTLSLEFWSGMDHVVIDIPSLETLTIAGGVTRSFPVTFKYLNIVRLNDLYLGDPRVLRCLFGMLESCPCIKELDISVISNKNAIQHKFDCSNNLKLDHLLEVNIIGITGSSAELKLIKYLHANSGVLEKLLFKCGRLDTESEMELYRSLMGFPRASPKARLVCASASSLGYIGFIDDVLTVCIPYWLSS